MSLKMADGYCYVLRCLRANWRGARNDSWEIEMYSPTGAERHVGFRWIDGSPCTVFACADGYNRAQTNVSVQREALKKEVRT